MASTQSNLKRLLILGLGVATWCVGAWASPPAREITNRKDGSVLVLVPAGPFEMGAADSDADGNEKPVNTVSLPACYIGKNDVTNAQYARFVQATHHKAGANWQRFAALFGDQAPVVEVSWNDAQAYCHWAGLRLPTEAEWEKAARGTDGRKYPWGNAWDPERAWWTDNCGGQARPVGSKPSGASPCGALDMAGNVWQWTSTQTSDYPYRAGDGREDPKAKGNRVIRGGGWPDLPWDLRVTHRNNAGTDVRTYMVGFRCAKTP